MKPILYEVTEREFSSNGLGRLASAIDCHVKEVRNGEYILTMKYPVNGTLYSEIKLGRIIGAIHDDKHDIQPFIIYQASKPINGVVTFYAHHLSYRLRNVILKPFTASSCAQAVSMLGTETYNSNPFTFWTDKDVSGAFTNDAPAAVRSMLAGQTGSILDVYGKGEYEFDKWMVKLHTNRGNDNGVAIRYGVNLTDITQQIDADDSYSAVAPFWRDSESGNVVMLPEGYVVANNLPITAVPWQDNNGETMTDDNGEPIYFNFTNVVPIPLDLSDSFEEEPTVAQLREKALSRLNSSEAWLPSENIKVSFVDLAHTENYKSSYASAGPAEMVHVDDALSVNAKKVTIDIDSASGVTGATLTQCGKNLIPLLIDRLKTLNSGKSWTGNTATEAGMSFEFQTGDSGEVVEIRVSGTYSRQVNVALGTVKLKAGEQYILNGVSTAPSWQTFQLYVTANGNKYASVPGTQFTVNADGEYPVYLSTYGTISDTVFYPMIRLASDADATFEPYVSIENTISFPTEAGTVIGGILDVTNGKLTVTNPEENAGVYDVTPTVIELFQGVNNIWANCGQVALQYVDIDSAQKITSLQRVSLCDQVSVYCGPIGVSAVKMQVISVDFDVLNERYNSIEMGKAKSTYAETLTKQVMANVDRATKEFVKASAMQAAVDNATKQITGAQDSHIRFIYDAGGGLQEIVILDTDDIATATKVWRFNSGGLGYSSNGYAGPYSIAMTQDGAIVADFVTTGILNANLVKAGVLASDQNPNNYWNMNTGEFVLTSNGQTNGIIYRNGVLHLNASNIDAGTLSANLIKAGTISDEQSSSSWNLNTGEFITTGEYVDDGQDVIASVRIINGGISFYTNNTKVGDVTGGKAGLYINADGGVTIGDVYGNKSRIRIGADGNIYLYGDIYFEDELPPYNKGLDTSVTIDGKTLNFARGILVSVS